MDRVYYKILIAVFLFLGGTNISAQEEYLNETNEYLDMDPVEMFSSTSGFPSTLELVEYYNIKNFERYLAYQKKYPEYTEEEIVWKVNANLDYPFYGIIREIDDLDKFPLLVNKYNKLPESYKPKVLVKLYNGLMVTPATRTAFDSLRKAASKQAYTIEAKSAYRSIVYQKNLYARYVARDGKKLADTYSARPGHSEHHTGCAIDVSNSVGSLSGFSGTKEATWVAENAWKFGFIVRYREINKHITGYKSEPWHLTYVGVEVSKKMHEENLSSLEEYIVKNTFSEYD